MLIKSEILSISCIDIFQVGVTFAVGFTKIITIVLIIILIAMVADVSAAFRSKIFLRKEQKTVRETLIVPFQEAIFVI